MQPSRVYGNIVRPRRHLPHRVSRDSPSNTLTPSAIATPGPAIRAPAPYDLDEARHHRAISRTRPLMISDWNGHLEITDECLLGLALFQIQSRDYTRKDMHIAFKDGLRAKKVEVHRILDLTEVRTSLFRRNHFITIPDLMLKHMCDRGVEQYLSEFTLVSQLLDKINGIESVRNRWIPIFSPPLSQLAQILNQDVETPLLGPSFEIQGGYTFKPRTLGQWFLMLLMERVRRQIRSGIGLRTLLYCVCWCSRLVLEHDYERLRASAAMIKTWLLQDACQDCVYKFLRELRADVAFEYIFNIADSFSDCITLPDMRTTIKIGICGPNDNQAPKEPGFLRTFGQHSFLTSPYANTTLPVRIRVLAEDAPKTFFMTGRQTSTLLTILDLHARVLRARDWRQCKRAFSACLRERRANDGESLNTVMRQLVEDLVALSCLSVSLSTTVAHFALLIFRGSLSVEMLQAYRVAREDQRLSAHTFIVRHCFLRAPTPDTQAYADSMFRAYINASPETQRSIIQYAIEDSEHRYELCEQEVNLSERWNIPDAASEDEVVDFFGGAEVIFIPRPRNEERWVEDPAVTQSEYDDTEQGVTPRSEEETPSGPRGELSADELALINMTLGDCSEHENVGSLYTIANEESFHHFRELSATSTSTTTSSVVEPNDEESVGHQDISHDD